MMAVRRMALRIAYIMHIIATLRNHTYRTQTCVRMYNYAGGGIDCPNGLGMGWVYHLKNI